MTKDRGAHPRILVVEDDAATAEMLTMMLGEAGYAVEVASTAAAAHDQLRQRPDDSRRRSGLPDLILLDLQLPDRDGAAMVEELARTQHLPPVIVLSAKREAAAVAAGDAIHARAVIPKPFEMETLLTGIAATLVAPNQACAADGAWSNPNHGDGSPLHGMIGRDRCLNGGEECLH